MSPWKYSWNRIRSRQCGSVWKRSTSPLIGRRPLYGAVGRYHTDPEWQNLLEFHEYFNGEDGAALGASHQTGWTGLVAALIAGGGALPRRSPARRPAGAGGAPRRPS